MPFLRTAISSTTPAKLRTATTRILPTINLPAPARDYLRRIGRGTIIVNHSAIIEFPSIDVWRVQPFRMPIYDAIYFTTGTHVLQNSLIGFCKDDAIDSGSGGAGTVVVSNCWIEAALHEANAWSGAGRQTWRPDDTRICINCGQGLECGWSTGTNSPLVRAERILSLGNPIGTRYGDNYSGTTGLGLKSGHLTVSNSFFIYNYRDILAARGTTPGLAHARHDHFQQRCSRPRTAFIQTIRSGIRRRMELGLAPFMHAPAGSSVGIGLPTGFRLRLLLLTKWRPGAFSTFTTHTVSVDYALETPESTLATGTLTFCTG